MMADGFPTMFFTAGSALAYCRGICALGLMMSSDNPHNEAATSAVPVNVLVVYVDGLQYPG